jgi:hypothetical protein
VLSPYHCDDSNLDTDFSPYPVHLFPLLVSSIGMFLQWMYIMCIAFKRADTARVLVITELDTIIGLWQGCRFLMWIVITYHLEQLIVSKKDPAVLCVAWNCTLVMLTCLSLFMLVVLVALSRLASVKGVKGV